MPIDIHDPNFRKWYEVKANLPDTRKLFNKYVSVCSQQEQEPLDFQDWLYTIWKINPEFDTVNKKPLPKID